MTFPTIPTTGNGRASSLNQLNTTATLTGPNLNLLTGRAAGDLVIAIAGEYQSNAAAGAAWTGWAGGGLTWTELVDGGGTTDCRLGVAYTRLVTGSETGAVTVTRSGTLTGDASMVLICIPGAHATQAPEATAVAVASAAAADPASLSPSWGSGDTLWITVCGNGMTAIAGSWTGIDGAPTNYGNLIDTNAADTSTIGDFSLGVAFRQNAAASEDAGGFTQDTSNARSAGLTIAVRGLPTVYDETGRTVTATATVTAGHIVTGGSGTTTFDAVGPSSAGAGGAAPSSPITFTHVCGGSNRVLLVGVAFGNDATGVTASVTYNGVSMTSLAKVLSNNTLTAGFAELFALLNPAAGSNTVSVSWTGAASPSAVETGSVSFSDVEQSSLAAALVNVATAFGNSANPSLNVSSATGALVASLLAMGNTITSAGDTQRWLKNVNGNSGAGNGGMSTQTGAATVTMDWTAALEWWAEIGVSIVPAPADAFVAGETQHMVETGRTVTAAATCTTVVRVPPILVDYQETTWMGNGAKSTPSVAWKNGDKIIVLGMASSEFGDLPVPTAAGKLTFTAGTPLDQTGSCWGNTWDATAGSDNSNTIDSAGETGSGAWGMGVWVVRRSEGLGNRATLADTTKVVSLTRSKAESMVIVGVADFAAGPVGGYAFTPAPADNEREASTNGVQWSIFVADWTDEDAAGATSYGITGTTSTGQHTKVALEILGKDVADIQSMKELARPCTATATVTERDAYVKYDVPSYIDTGVASIGNTSDTIQTKMPWLWKPGDLLILDVLNFGPSTTTLTTDMAALGWAQVSGSPATMNFGGLWRFQKVAPNGETGPAVTFSTQDGKIAHISSIRNHNFTGDSANTVTTVNDTTPAPVPSAVVVNGSMLMVAYANRYSAAPSGTHTPDADYTERLESHYDPGAGAAGVLSFSTRDNLSAGTISGDTFTTSLAARDALIVTEVIPAAAISTLTEDWSGGTIGPQFTTSDPGSQAFISGGALVLDPPAVDDYVQVDGTARFRLTNSSVFAEIPNLNSFGSHPSRQAGMQVIGGPNNYVDFGIFGNNLGYIFNDTEPGGGGSDFEAYNATNHRWLRIRADATTMYFDTSPDGTTWTNWRSHAAPWWSMGSVYASFFAGWFGAGDPDFGSITVDNINVVPSGAINETGRLISIAGTVTRTDVQAMKELDRTVTAAATVTPGDVAHRSDLALPVAATATVTAISNRYRPTVLADSPTHVWHLDETSGSTANDAVGTAHGTYTGSPTLGTGKLTPYDDTGTAVTFSNAVPQYISVPDEASLNPTSISVEAIVWANSLSGNNRIIQKGDSDNHYRLLYDGGQNAFVWDLPGHTVVSTPVLATGARHHLLCTYDETSGVAAIYVNGSLAAQRVENAGALGTTTTPLYIGTKNAAAPGGDAWDGPLDEVAFYNYALSAAQAERHARAAGLYGDFRTVTATATVTAFDTFQGTANETGRLVTAAVTVAATDIQAHKEPSRTVTASLTSTATSVQAHKELALLVTATVSATVTSAQAHREATVVTAAVTATATGTQAMRELARTVTAAATITASDQLIATGQEHVTVTVAATVTRTDVQAMKEPDRTVVVAGTVTAPSVQHYQELARPALVAATTTAAVDKQAHKELTRPVTATAPVTLAVNTQAHKELTRSVSAGVTVTATDTQYTSAQEFRTVTAAATVTAQDVVRRVDTDKLISIAGTVTVQSIQHMAEAKAVLALATVSVTALQHMAEARAVTILATVIASDFYRPLESLEPWHQPAGTITSATGGAVASDLRPRGTMTSATPNGSITKNGQGAGIYDTIPDTTITDRRGQ